jgi:hypothetical protein
MLCRDVCCLGRCGNLLCCVLSIQEPSSDNHSTHLCMSVLPTTVISPVLRCGTHIPVVSGRRLFPKITRLTPLVCSNPSTDNDDFGGRTTCDALCEQSCGEGPSGQHILGCNVTNSVKMRMRETIVTLHTWYCTYELRNVLYNPNSRSPCRKYVVYSTYAVRRFMYCTPTYRVRYGTVQYVASFLA